MAESDNRETQMTVDLGDEQVMVERARCSEAVGEPFTLQVDIIAAHGEIDLLPHLGKPIAVHAYEDDEFMRDFHGLITAGEFTHESGAGLHYRLVARPYTYFLSQNRDMAIFQDMDTPAIIRKVLGKHKGADYRLQLTKTYAPRTYCVQYRESEWGFLTRLMEEDGLYYYWEHKADKHVLVICDAPSAHSSSKPASVSYNLHAERINRSGSQQRGASSWYLNRFGERVMSGGEQLVTLRAFDFQKPERPLQAQANDASAHRADSNEVYSYPGRFTKESDGNALAKVRLNGLRRDRKIYAGRTQAISLAAGTKVSVAGHPAGRMNQSYLIVRAEHVLQAEQHYGGDTGNYELEEETHVDFEAIPADTPFQLPQITPRPVVQGLETAIISGPQGEEIYTDKYGRVKVRFHWDRGDTPGENSTCWIRVAQFGGLGNIILPRVHQEVMVDFLHGNPDEPIVVGWVFNQSHMPIYPLPDNKTRALWRTKSYPGGKSSGFADTTTLDTGSPGANELRFEDKSGHEEVFLHAEKDMNVRVRHDQTNHVGHNQYEKVHWDRDAYVERHETTMIKKGDQTLTIDAGKQTETINGDRDVTIKTGNDKLTVKLGNKTTEVKTGNITTKAALGKIEMEAMQSIELKVGGSSIKIDQIGITIKGTVMVKVQGVMVQSQADAMQTIKGGMVMIN
jgi:type VI secretion system secreted protein VgrG